jgi:hypothetical protein
MISESRSSGRIEVNLDVSLGFISDLHQELGLGVNHMLQDALIDTATSR